MEPVSPPQEKHGTTLIYISSLSLPRLFAILARTFAGTSARPPAVPVIPETPPSPPKTAAPRGGRSGVANSKLRSAAMPPSPRPLTALLARDFLEERGAPQYLVRLLPCADSWLFLAPAAGPRGAGMELPRHAASAAAAASLKARSGADATLRHGDDNGWQKGASDQLVSYARPESTEKKKHGRHAATNPEKNRRTVSHSRSDRHPRFLRLKCAAVRIMDRQACLRGATTHKRTSTPSMPGAKVLD